jgi:dUTP pyrophosphatase
VDADYRGEIKVILINHSREAFPIHAGDRIAQGVCHLCLQLPDLKVLESERGEGGFGSTGKK